MSNEVIRVIHEFEYNGYTTKIVERKLEYKSCLKSQCSSELFLDFDVYDSNGNHHGGLNYVYFNDVKKEELSDLSIAVPKIKDCIDYMIKSHLEFEAETERKKKEINWTGQEFQRGDYVHYKGSSEFKPCDTYVWTFFSHMGSEFYLIEHKDGFDRSSWMTKPPFEEIDGFESVHSSQLGEDLAYIEIDCSRDFQGETDELILLKRKE